jgi:GAF domain-containing protein
MSPPVTIPTVPAAKPDDLPAEAPAREPLEAVLITEELGRRPYRGPNFAAENEALVALMRCLAATPGEVLTLLARKAMELCRAHSAGISIEEGSGPAAVFRWHAVAGVWSRFQGQALPRWFTPCATVLEQDRALLVAAPERHWDIPPEMSPLIVEALLVPFRSKDRPVGTVWVLAHDHHKRFDREDLRLMESLAAFAGAAYHALLRA